MIPMWVNKNNFLVLGHIITEIVNKSLMTGSFSSKFKMPRSSHFIKADVPKLFLAIDLYLFFLH